MKAALVVAGLALTGCTTTAQGLRAVEANYLGKNTDLFFVEHGPPADTHQLNDGDVLYMWESGWVATQGGNEYKARCRLRILAGATGIIRTIKIEQDTWGLRETSRCAEIFR